MLKFIFSILFACCSYSLLAQDTTLTAEEKKSLDSMFRSDEFIKLFNERTDTSYVDLSVGVSNGAFSLKNNSLNTEQATTNKIFFTPSAGYYHKSGFGIGINAFLASDSGKFKSLQYALSPSYSYYGKKVSAGISYTRYIKGAAAGFEINPYKNDLYANLVMKKYWLRPGIGAGYSSGRIKEYFDTSFIVTFPAMPPREFSISDTITTKISSFSLNVSVSHQWDFKNIFTHADELELKPYLFLNGSNQKFQVHHSSSINKRRPVVQNLLKAAFGSGTTTVPFKIESIAGEINISYETGKFIIQPQLYLDYYLSDTSGKRFTSLYSFVISYAF